MAKDRNLVSQAAGIMSSFWIDLGKEIQELGGSEGDILALGNPQNTLTCELVAHCAQRIVDASRSLPASLTYFGSQTIAGATEFDATCGVFLEDGAFNTAIKIYSIGDGFQELLKGMEHEGADQGGIPDMECRAFTLDRSARADQIRQVTMKEENGELYLWNVYELLRREANILPQREAFVAFVWGTGRGRVWLVEGKWCRGRGWMLDATPTFAAAPMGMWEGLKFEKDTVVLIGNPVKPKAIWV
jgi:hypothetical protein